MFHVHHFVYRHKIREKHHYGHKDPLGQSNPPSPSLHSCGAALETPPRLTWVIMGTKDGMVLGTKVLLGSGFKKIILSPTKIGIPVPQCPTEFTWYQTDKVGPPVR